MSVQILADLHLETPKAYDTYDITPKAPYLALLGDIGSIVSDKDDYLEFLTKQLKQFRIVFLVPGNHEPYQSDWDEAISVFREYEQIVSQDSTLGDFVFLDRRAYHLPDTNVVILGCSLFSFIPAERLRTVSMGINDFYYTSNWTVEDHVAAHHRDLTWLNNQVVEFEQKGVSIVIFTHWTPTTNSKAIDPRHANSSISSAFSTDMSDEPCFKSEKVKLWAFGHTHYNCDFKVERDNGSSALRLLANQRGYYIAQTKGFDPNMVVNLTEG